MKTATNPGTLILSIALTGLLVAALPAPSVAATFSGNLKEVTITDAQATNKPPVAAFSYTVNGNTVTFDASGSSDADGSISTYKWDFGDGTTAEGASVTHQFSAAPAPVTLTVIDDKGGVTLAQKTVQLPKQVNVAVSFQPDNAPIESGFLVDSGQAYNATTGYGWVSPPLSLGTRDRNSSLSPNQAYDTFIHVVSSGIWEMDVPNGTYLVTICVGDPAYPGGTHVVSAENLIIINDQISSSALWIEKNSLISVTDGKLTLTFSGTSKEAKLCWVKVVSQ